MERTLSRNEARVVLDLEWHRKTTITLGEIRRALSASPGYARYVAHRLVKKGWFERVRPGLFQLVPADRGREGVVDTHPLTAGALLVAPYFFSFGTACTHHGLTEQVFTEAYLVCQERRRARMVRGKRYIFVCVPRRRFFGYEETSVLGRAVQMATVERALLDAVDRPEYAGGIGEVSRIVAKAASKVSWKSCLDLARRWGSSALVQRFGYFLDLHRIPVPSPVRASLLNLVHARSKILLGSRRKWGTKGRLVPLWNVVENVPRSVLISNDEKPRRRITFRGKGSLR
jgi:predicted transcriptional regulator of viral defense system